jgi:hypothetical protein
MKRTNLLLFSTLLVFWSCENKREIKVVIENANKLDQTEVVEIDLATYRLDSKESFVAQTSDAQQLPSQFFDIDDDGIIDKAQVLVDLPTSEKLVLYIVKVAKKEEKKMTQAELSIKTGGSWEGNKYIGGDFKNVTSLSVPDSHTDHSFFIRYEGPGWESDKAAYRFYLDWRNGVDYFGKKTSEVVLQNVGLDGFDSYHEPSDWGMDLLKVGKTLGLGSIGRYENDSLYRFQLVDSVFCAVAKNGSLESEIVTNYYGWQTETEKTDLISVISIQAGSALTKHSVNLSNPITGFCTGLVINKDETYIDKTEGKYRLLATFGSFSLNKDEMGLAIIVENESIESVFDGLGSHVVRFKPQNDITYYFLAAWSQDLSGVKSSNDFEKLMDQELQKLNSPLIVSNQ